MTRRERSIIIGAGVAAANAASALRADGYDGDIVVFGDEPDEPYDRPPLSKAYLQGGSPEIAARPDTFWAEHDIELRLGVLVDSIDTHEKEIEAGGERIGYDRLLLATGGGARRTGVSGDDLPGVHVLRTVADARAIRDAAGVAQRAVVIGMGFIGAEVAASLRMRGLDVVAISPVLPLERALGPQVGAAVARLHASHGVDVRIGVSLSGFEGAGRVERVLTDDGQSIECDFVVAGVGIAPNIDLAGRAGIAIGDGVIVDSMLRTSATGVFAAGDVASHDHPLFGRVRVEHWQNAIEMGAAAGRAMAGRTEPYRGIHWFWSDQFDSVLQYAGHHRDAASVVYRGDPHSQQFLAFYLDASGAVRAVAGIDRGSEVRRATGLIESRRIVDPALLASDDVDLKALAREGR